MLARGMPRPRVSFVRATETHDLGGGLAFPYLTGGGGQGASRAAVLSPNVPLNSAEYWRYRKILDIFPVFKYYRVP